MLRGENNLVIEIWHGYILIQNGLEVFLSHFLQLVE